MTGREEIEKSYQEIKDNLLGVLTDEDGNEEEITNEQFFELIKEVTATPYANKETIEKTKVIIAAIVKLQKEHPEIVTGQISENILKSLNVIYGYLLDITNDENKTEPKATTRTQSRKISNVNEYVITKDILSKAIFGEPGRDGKQISIVAPKPGALTLWTTGKGQNKKEVAIYTRLEFDREALKAAGITIGKNVSKRGREVFGAMLSHYLAGNKLLTLGMLGKIIFNTRSDNLTDEQKKYIIDGAQEVFGTSLYINTAFSTDEAKRAIISLKQAHEVNIERFETLFPGRITSAYIKGNLVETAIELFELPTLYTLQKTLEKGQILRAPAEVLAIPGRADADLISIRAYLLRRIDAMRHNQSLSRMIIFKNILDELGIDTTDRAQRNKPAQALKRTKRILNYWKEQAYIHDYSELTRNGKPLTKGGTIYEIEISI